MKAVPIPSRGVRAAGGSDGRYCEPSPGAVGNLPGTIEDSDEAQARVVSAAKRAMVDAQPLVRSEKLMGNGLTKLLTWTDQATGDIAYAAAVEPTTVVNLVSTGEVDGIHEIGLRPEEPGTDEGAAARGNRAAPGWSVKPAALPVRVPGGCQGLQLQRSLRNLFRGHAEEGDYSVTLSDGARRTPTAPAIAPSLRHSVADEVSMCLPPIGKVRCTAASAKFRRADRW